MPVTSLSQPSTLFRRSPVVQSQTLTTLSAPLLASRYISEPLSLDRLAEASTATA